MKVKMLCSQEIQDQSVVGGVRLLDEGQVYDFPEILAQGVVNAGFAVFTSEATAEAAAKAEEDAAIAAAKEAVKSEKSAAKAAAAGAAKAKGKK